jgi:hypothetical protein
VGEVALADTTSRTIISGGSSSVTVFGADPEGGEITEAAVLIWEQDRAGVRNVRWRVLIVLQ